jgi:AraC-like DNA-binding protein
VVKWIRSGALKGAPDLVANLGGDWRTLFTEAGLPLDALADLSTPVRVDALARFFVAAAESLDCESFGLRLAQFQTFSLFGPLSQLFRSARTIGELLTDLARYFPIHTQGALVALVETPDGLEVDYGLAAGTGIAHRQIAELGFAILVNEIRCHLPGWDPEYITLRHAAPADRSWHRRLLGSRIEFNADRNTVFVDRGQLAMPTCDGSMRLHSELAARYDSVRRSTEGTVAADVESLVRAFMPYATIDLARAALMTGMSRRTLQRRLAMDGVGLAEIVDSVRADLAISYLRESRLSVTEISEILQFSETSAFSHAVTRWFGQSPRALRKAATTGNSTIAIPERLARGVKF